MNTNSTRPSFVSWSSDGAETPSTGGEDFSDPTLAERPSADEQQFSEHQLRRLYEEEEVERFMYFFSAYVTEVRLPSASKVDNVTPPDLLSQPGAIIEHRSPSPIPPPLPRRPGGPPLSEMIAYFILPYLPLDGHTPPPFTVKRLRMTIQRLYLATIPPYQALLLDLVSLALWKDQKRSFLCCACFWMLWYHDLLLAALLCRMLWCLLRYRLLPYPSLEELQAKRRNAAQARRFGEEIQQQLSTSTLGPVDVWRLFRYYNKVTPESNAKKSAKVDPNGDKTILEHSEDSQEALDLKRELLHILDIIADLHERIRNILTWRRPAVTRRYVILLSIMTVTVLVLPAHYIAKLIGLFWGVVYWHCVPVIAAFSPHERTRIPPIFGDAPTDAEYAMDLIGERVASGQDIKLHHKRSNHHIHVANASNNVGSTTVESSCYDPSEDKDGVNWKKWGARIAQGKSLLEDSKPISSIGRVVRDKLLPEKQAISDSSEVEQTYTFPAQHSSALGLITLTPSTVYFTSVTSIRPKLVIPRNQLRGVKKTGLMKGLSIRWISADQEAQGEESEERFHWVGSRDELFARLLGPESRRWIRV